MLDAVKVSDLEEIKDQDTVSNMWSVEKIFACCILKLKVFTKLLLNGE